MRKLVLPTIACFVLVGLAPAHARGMGDPSTVLKEKNAICDAQRRGEVPRNPDMCLPELPVDAGAAPSHSRYK